MRTRNDEVGNFLCPIRSDAENDRFCVGPECMAWRLWRLEDEKLDGEQFEQAQGYCGLAGRP